MVRDKKCLGFGTIVMMSLRDYGWVWEGQGIDPGVYPSVLGVGDGARYFGLERVCYMFHPNDEFAVERLRDMKEVVCDISKWKWTTTADGGIKQKPDSSKDTVVEEAKKVSHLSKTYRNISGAIHDDFLGLARKYGLGVEDYEVVYQALKSENPDLKLWSVVYTHELSEALWKDFRDLMDVISLWVWNSKDLPRLDSDIERCKKIFPGKPLIIGCYLRDYPARQPVPIDRLRNECELVQRRIEDGTIQGFSILGSVLIDTHRAQSEWIREFLSHR